MSIERIVNEDNTVTMSLAGLGALDILCALRCFAGYVEADAVAPGACLVVAADTANPHGIPLCRVEVLNVQKRCGRLQDSAVVGLAAIFA